MFGKGSDAMPVNVQIDPHPLVTCGRCRKMKRAGVNKVPRNISGFNTAKQRNAR